MPANSVKEIQWRGKNVSELSHDMLLKLYATLNSKLEQRASTEHNKRTEKLKIDFKSTENGYFKQLLIAIEAALKQQKGIK